jgi:hypothetical protein
MEPEIVRVADSKRAVAFVAEHMRGSRIRIADLFAKQNVLVEANPYRGGRPVARRKLNPDCSACLRDWGHTIRVPAYTDFDKGAELRPPKRLQECRETLGGVVPTIEMETDYGVRFSFALSQGCRAGWGTIEEREKMMRDPMTLQGKPSMWPYSVIVPSGRDAEDARSFIFPDPGVVLVSMQGKLLNGLSTMGGSSTDGFWRSAGMESLKVRKVLLSVKEEWDQVRLAYRMLEFVFRLDAPAANPKSKPEEISLMLNLGDDIDGVEPFFWIDMTSRDGHTTRFMVENGFTPLLFPNHFKTPF